MRRSSSCARVALPLTWLFSRSATPAIRASARLYCVILRAELLARRLHQRFRIRFFDAADEQAEKAPEQPSDARKHASSSSVGEGDA